MNKKAPKIRAKESRSAYIARAAEVLYDALVPLPAARDAIALALGEDPSSPYALVAAAYYRIVGERTPLVATTPKGNRRPLARAIRARRDGTDGAVLPEGTPKGIGLVRWDTLAASARIGYGLAKISPGTVQDLYAEAGGDLDSSYAGRGTRASAPNSRKDRASEARTASEGTASE